MGVHAFGHDLDTAGRKAHGSAERPAAACSAAASPLSADGSTALIGGAADDEGAGAAWVFTRSGAAWTQQGPKLTAAGETGTPAFGSAVALSADGDAAVIGGPYDSFGVGAAWVFDRSGSTWTRGPRLTSGGEPAGKNPTFGSAVALAPDGRTILVGEPLDGVDAACVFTRSGTDWSRSDVKLKAR